ncbi:MAG: hypothetical protein LQ338_008086 [Usnochroma carphineum]|nr:MAG: hypothetical protein LQ338_008086 [Usnochroma carphineum]
MDELCHRICQPATNPFLIIGRQIHGAIEAITPFDVGGVEMRMRDYNGTQATQLLDLRTLSQNKGLKTLDWRTFGSVQME